MFFIDKLFEIIKKYTNREYMSNQEYDFKEDDDGLKKDGDDFKEGDVVKVKPDIKDPDLGTDISGWVGRIEEIEDDLILIEWDSLTLSNMTAASITKCEQEGMDWSCMWLSPSDLEHTQERDSAYDVHKTQNALMAIHKWDDFEEGARIYKVLEQVDPSNEWAYFEAWKKYLETTLKFPFEAEVYEFQEKGPLRQGDKVKVSKIFDVVDMYGILVTISYKRAVYQFPLCDLEVINKKSVNYHPVKDYAVWFANR
ncbi:MAG: hypothetical protein HQK62_15195 [Desulfamplus sp.]|nr:hypothetical protein [Desulfamplus sp.]